MLQNGHQIAWLLLFQQPLNRNLRVKLTELRLLACDNLIEVWQVSSTTTTEKNLSK